ncbi:metallophosphoesterase [Oceanococcus atlanticus]|uniref:Metallophosphoesterase n=1 Tax=Oceanococcus atlanticus TaxID=1317117 RepID=A0A1Y1SDI7_9GAMM|nr:metallophosphoesterase [Oceanococcus atlanticus]ORE87056.1 metallophosphoesterase [Oceanococcus atlanticus]
MSEPPVRLACIGDVHGFWDRADTRYFNQSHYQGLLFTGDLPRFTNAVPVARRLAELNKPAWLIPGNHDGPSPMQLLAELKGWQALCDRGAASMPQRMQALQRALGDIALGGYKLFAISPHIGLITARPHAMGPDRFYFRRYMAQAHAVRNYQDSAERLKQLVDAAPGQLVFLAHNGPSGLGEQSTDIWGCDFSPQFGDFGDRDLRVAIDYAQTQGKQVLAVVAGHMHHRHKRGGGVRQPAVRQDGVLYINAASVARIRGKGARRHHVALSLQNGQAKAQECWVDEAGMLLSQTALAPA